MAQLIMATNNAHKLSEIRQILGDEYEVKGLADIGCHEDIPETADTLEGNALQKARYVHEHYGVDCFADDTGLEVDALGGAPGIYTARFGHMNGYGDSHDSTANIRCLLAKLEGVTNRAARFRTAIALIQGGEEHLFEGIVEGTIVTELRGTDGFGYDPVFEPAESGLTFAEMGPAEKNRISHRGRATQKLVAFLRNTLALFMCLFCFVAAQAQSIGQWQLYRSFREATQCVAVGKTIYAHFKGNLLSYDTEDSDLRTYDKLTGLNGVTIAQMAYCPQAKRLVLVYDDCGIDLMDADDNVLHIAALKDKDISGKTVNGLTVDGKMAYIATAFGMVELDVEEGVLLRSYLLDKAVNAAVKWDGDYYLATSNGLLQGKQDDNLFVKENWRTVADGNWSVLYTMPNGLIGLLSGVATTFTPSQGAKTVFNFTGSYMSRIATGFVWGSWRTFVCNDDATEIRELHQDPQAKRWQHVQTIGSTYWACEGEGGLCAYKAVDGTLARIEGPIQLNSPVRDVPGNLSWVGDRLLVAGGQNGLSIGRWPATSMIYEDGQWTVFEEMAKPADRPGMDIINTTHLVQDPADPAHHFASVFRTGLCEYRDGKFVKLYDDSNSTLASILPDDAYPYNYVSCSGAQYDAEGNLWMLNSTCPHVVHVMKPDGKWVALKYTELYVDDKDRAKMCDEYLMHSSGVRFLNVRYGDVRGIFAFDTKGTLENVKDDRHRLIRVFYNQDGERYDPDFFYGFAEDLDGRVWCCTSDGPFVINDPASFFNDDFRFEQVKVNRNDGSGLADYLLKNVHTTCIAVDGGNRKWIGTQGSGLYLISADGQEMLHHFTSADSPLLGNSIYSIAVHPTTGHVMISTDNGLCSYGGDATEAEEELEGDKVLVYPNPVTPDYTGPIAVRGLAMDSEVKILSSSGQLVWSGVSNGGMFTWNGCNRQGNRVASGVYHIVANNAEGSKAIVARIIVAR